MKGIKITGDETERALALSRIERQLNGSDDLVFEVLIMQAVTFTSDGVAHHAGKAGILRNPGFCQKLHLYQVTGGIDTIVLVEAGIEEKDH
jgi:hypothetical protein